MSDQESGLQSYRPGFRFQFCQLLVMEPGLSYLTFLGQVFLFGDYNDIYTIGLVSA